MTPVDEWVAYAGSARMPPIHPRVSKYRGNIEEHVVLYLLQDIAQVEIDKWMISRGLNIAKEYLIYD